MKFHTKRRWMENIKHLDTYLVTFFNHIRSCHVSSWALEQANPGCVVIWKTFDNNMTNTEIFQRVFWSFKPSIVRPEKFPIFGKMVKL